MQKDQEYHYRIISSIEAEHAKKGVDRSLAWYRASVELSPDEFKALAKRLRCSPATRTKYVKGGEFFSKLSSEDQERMPDSSTTTYEIALASPELREKAFKEGVITKGLTRERWLVFVRENRARQDRPKTLLRIHRPSDQSREEELLQRAKQWAVENSVAIEIPVEKLSKKRASVKERILAIAHQNPTMPVEELVKVLDLRDAA